MPYVTSIEQIGIKKGIQQGRIEGRSEGEMKGKADLVLRLLKSKFGSVPSDTESRIRTADSILLDNWAERVLNAGTLADVFEMPRKSH